MPCPMPGLSTAAKSGSIGGNSGLAALARVGLAGSFFACLAGSRLGFSGGLSETFAIVVIWEEMAAMEVVEVAGRISASVIRLRDPAGYGEDANAAAS